MSNANYQAFPLPGFNFPNGEFCHPEGGLTKREYIAAQVLGGFLAMHSGADVNSPDYDRAARCAVQYADALLVELSK